MIRRLVTGALCFGLLSICGQSADAQMFGGRMAGARTIGYGNTNDVGSRLAWGSRSTWGDYWAYDQSMQKPWHGSYYYLKTGQPTALIVPPTVTMQSNYSWGVSQNTMTPVYHQFSGAASNGGSGGMFHATPYWPSHTDQFGVYPVRGPW